MQLNPGDFDPLCDLAAEIADNPERWETPAKIAAAIRRETARLKTWAFTEDR